MRATRAYIASLGTAGVLVASSALLLVVVSALMAFNAWPGGDPMGGLRGLVVGNHEPSLELTGPARVAADAAPAAAAVAAAPAGTAAPAAGGLASPVPPDGGSSTPGGVSQPRSTTEAPSGRRSGGPAASVPGTPPAPDVEGVTHGVGGGVEQVTGGTGKAVGVVSPDVGKGVTDTGKALSEIVQGIGPGAQKQLSPPKLP
jgi:hypothetical protein